MARRRVLPRRVAAGTGTALRQPRADRPRSQRHLLQHTAARHLRPLARRDARGLRVRRQGAPAGHAAQDAGRGRRGRGPLSGERRHRTARQARPHRLAVAAVPALRRRRRRVLPRPAARRRGWPAAAPCAGAAPRQLCLRRLRAPGAQLRRRHRLHRLARLPEHRRPDGRLRLRSAHAFATRRSHGLPAACTRPVGSTRAPLGKR